MAPVFTGYSLFDEMRASPVDPHPRATWWHTTAYAYEALGNLIDQSETLVKMGLANDPDKLLDDAVAAMAGIAQDHCDLEQPLRLDGERRQVLYAVVEDYATLLATVPARDMIRCHRQTEKRRAAYHAKRKRK